MEGNRKVLRELGRTSHDHHDLLVLEGSRTRVSFSNHPRLYNGYMAEETDLANVSVLFQYPKRVNQIFKDGMLVEARKATKKK